VRLILDPNALLEGGIGLAEDVSLLAVELFATGGDDVDLVGLEVSHE
jgi:hypothetical protein